MSAILTMMLLLATPTVEDIVTRYERAVGDPAVARSHESRIVRSTYEESTGTEGEMFEYFFGPDKYLQLLVLHEGALFRFASDGKQVWNDAPHGVDAVPIEKMGSVARDAVFNRHLKLREIYPQMRVVGSAAVAGKPAWQVEAVAPDGEKEQLFFDAGSGLLVRRTYAYVMPSGWRIPRDFLYEEYSDFGGVRMPSRIRQFSPGAAMIRVLRVDHNADLFEQMFAPPKCGEKKP